MTGRHSVKRPIRLSVGLATLTLPGEHGLDPVATRVFWHRVATAFRLSPFQRLQQTRSRLVGEP